MFRCVSEVIAWSFHCSAVVGFFGIMSILVFTMITHEIGRIAGPSWLVVGVIAYLIYRKRKKLPVSRFAAA